MKSIFLPLGLGLFLFACDTDPVGSGTGGVDPGGSNGGSVRGIVAVLSDYLSTQVALLDKDGNPLSANFLSTGSTKTSGVSFALSGDVTIPNTPPASGRVVLLDRYGTNVLTWADPETAKVTAQLPVGTGFESNPQDYLEIDDNRAYVTRWGENASPGAAPFDTGSDVLVIDTRVPQVTSSIPMPRLEGYPPRPSGMVRVKGTVLVVLQNVALDFASSAESQLVGIENDAVAWTVGLGARGCGRPVLSPSGARLGLSCAGRLNEKGIVAEPEATGVLLLDMSAMPPKVTGRFAIADQIQQTTQDGLAFASEDVVIGKTQSAVGATVGNRVFALDTRSGKVSIVASAADPARGLTYGSVFCVGNAPRMCMVADTESSSIQRWTAGADGTLSPMPAVKVDAAVGLPPVTLAAY